MIDPPHPPKKMFCFTFIFTFCTQSGLVICSMQMHAAAVEIAAVFLLFPQSATKISAWDVWAHFDVFENIYD